MLPGEEHFLLPGKEKVCPQRRESLPTGEGKFVHRWGKVCRKVCPQVRESLPSGDANSADRKVISLLAHRTVTVCAIKSVRSIKRVPHPFKNTSGFAVVWLSLRVLLFILSCSLLDLRATWALTSSTAALFSLVEKGCLVGTGMAQDNLERAVRVYSFYSASNFHVQLLEGPLYTNKNLQRFFAHTGIWCKFAYY